MQRFIEAGRSLPGRIVERLFPQPTLVDSPSAFLAAMQATRAGGFTPDVTASITRTTDDIPDSEMVQTGFDITFVAGGTAYTHHMDIGRIQRENPAANTAGYSQEDAARIVLGLEKELDHGAPEAAIAQSPHSSNYSKQSGVVVE